MMKFIKILWVCLLVFVLHSCTTIREVRYVQPSESLSINEEGLIPYNVQEYRIIKGDILNLNIVTTPKGDAAQFYSSYNTSGGGNSGNATGGGSAAAGGNGGGGNPSFYFNGLRVDNNGNVNIMGIGEVKAEGKTIPELAAEIQDHVNENFLEGKSQVRVDTDGLTYYILGDMESTGLTGEKKAYLQRLNILEAIAQNGGFNRTIDRKDVRILRKYPEGIKEVKLDLTREDVMNSPYFWLQNGDMILLNTRPKNMYGFGKEPLQTLTTGISLVTTALSVYLLLSRF